MSKPELTKDEYIDELNEELKEHEYYEKGMAFYPYSEGVTGRGVAGYSVKGPHSKIGVFAQVAQKVSENYNLKV